MKFSCPSSCPWKANKKWNKFQIELPRNKDSLQMMFKHFFGFNLLLFVFFFPYCGTATLVKREIFAQFHPQCCSYYSRGYFQCSSIKMQIIVKDEDMRIFSYPIEHSFEMWGWRRLFLLLCFWKHFIWIKSSFAWLNVKLKDKLDTLWGPGKDHSHRDSALCHPGNHN